MNLSTAGKQQLMTGHFSIRVTGPLSLNMVQFHILTKHFFNCWDKRCPTEFAYLSQVGKATTLLPRSFCSESDHCLVVIGVQSIEFQTCILRLAFTNQSNIAFAIAYNDLRRAHKVNTN